MSDSLYTIQESYARYSFTDEAYEKIREYLPEEHKFTINGFKNERCRKRVDYKAT